MNLREAIRLFLLVALIGTAACDDRFVPVGRWLDDASVHDPDASVPPDAQGPLDGPAGAWHAGFEPGDLGEWTTAYHARVNDLEVTDIIAHEGQRALMVKVGDMPLAEQTTALVVRRDLPAAARYRAWYHFPEAPRLESFLTIFKFRAGRSPDALDNLLGVTLRPGSPRLTISYLAEKRTIEVGDVELPVGRWFPIEVYLRVDGASAGAFSVAFDGRVVAEVMGDVLVSHENREWQLGAVTGRAAAFTFYIDDAEIQPTTR